MLLFQQLVVGSETDNLGTSIVPDSTVQTDTLKLNVNDSTVIAVDSLQSDTTAESDEVIKSKIKYHAKDSIRVNLENEIVYLYGEATVDYEDLLSDQERTDQLCNYTGRRWLYSWRSCEKRSGK